VTPRWLALALFVLPAALAAQAPATRRIRIVVYQFTPAAQDSTSSALARRTTRALVARLSVDSAFEVLGRPDSTARRPRPQFAIIGSVVIQGRDGRADLRVLDLANVQVITRKTVAIEDPYSPDAPILTGAHLARLVREHFIR
jgi:hypothetical protein